MKSNDSKAARYLALLNASAMIETHGKDGGFAEDEFPFDVALYNREKIKVGRLLSKMAKDYKQKYNL